MPRKPTKCADCGSAGPRHRTTCDYFKCPECSGLPNTTGHLKRCSKYGAKSATKAARDEAAAKKTEQAPLGTFFPVAGVTVAFVEELQRKINEGFFAGENQSQIGCQYQEAHGDRTVNCSNVAPPGMVQKTVFHCPTCDRDKKTAKLKLCFPHAILVWGGGQPAHAQTEMELK